MTQFNEMGTLKTHFNREAHQSYVYHSCNFEVPLKMVYCMFVSLNQIIFNLTLK